MAEMNKKSRMIKTPEELFKIKQAVALTEKAVQYGFSAFKPGMTEKELAKKIKAWVKSKGLKMRFCIVQGDKNSAMIHSKPSDSKIEKILLLDLGVIYKGYHGDISRTYLIKPTKEMRKVYAVVKKAYELSLAAVMPGASCRDVDAVARKFLKKKGYKFKHSLGHGVGLQIHEYPKIGTKSNHVFQKGMVFTIEPGVYLKGKFGIRIEDVFLMKTKVHKLGRLKIPLYD